MAKARRTQVRQAIQYIRSKQFSLPVQFLEKFQDLVWNLDSKTKGKLVDDDIINDLRVASSDDAHFCGQVSVAAAIWAAQNPMSVLLITRPIKSRGKLHRARHKIATRKTPVDIEDLKWIWLNYPGTGTNVVCIYTYIHEVTYMFTHDMTYTYTVNTVHVQEVVHQK